MSGSAILWQPGSVLRSVVHVSTEGYEGAGDKYRSRKLMSEGHAELKDPHQPSHAGASSDVSERKRWPRFNGCVRADARVLGREEQESWLHPSPGQRECQLSGGVGAEKQTG